MATAELSTRFLRTARAAGAEAPDHAVEAVGAELTARWSEPQRHYHTVAHLVDCLSQVESEPVVALAAWAHDAVYDPRSPANEERSALLACGLLARCALPVSVITEVARLVRLTAGHAPAVGDRFGVMLADADLSVLARPRPQYEAYVAAVRAEYAHVPDDQWRVGRAAVLTRLLALPALYRTTPHLEAPARTNLTQELSTLPHHHS